MQYTSDEYNEILSIFKAESEEIIQKLNDRFMEFEKNPEDKIPLKELFQLAHSLKGGARMLGFNSIQDISHKLEDILSCLKNGNVKPTPEFFKVIYKTCDFLYELVIKSVENKSDYINNTTISFLNTLDYLVNKELSNGNNTINDNFDFVLSHLKNIRKGSSTSFPEIINCLKNISQLTINEKIKVIISKVINILEISIKKKENFTNNSYIVILQSIFLSKQLLSGNNTTYESNYNSIIERLNIIEDALSLTKNSDLISKENPLSLNNNFTDTLKTIDLQEIKTLRVDTSKLDNLISQTGELLINGIKTREHIMELSKINNKLTKWNSVSKKILNYLKYLEKKGVLASECDEGLNIFYKKMQQYFNENAEFINEINKDFSNLYNITLEDDNKLHQTTKEIESIAKAIRVLPLATLFHSFPRMIRDIANENNKKINFIISGSDTSVDKKIIEEIKMPLIHILRNSISHGIELPHERLKLGKSEEGTVRLTSKNENNNVIITIEDDGYGVNIEKVKEKAVEKGLLTEDEILHMDSKQLMKLIFFPGFSTEEEINEISGRGIGLDIVKTKINNLNGEIFVDSILNKGCKVTIKLPLSMSAIKTFIILINNQKYALPINTIKYVMQINEEQIFEKNKTKYIIYNEHSIPVYYMSNLFGEKYNKDENNQLTVIIVENHEKETAYIVDRLIGSQEVFQKKLIPPIIKIKNISGFTILSTGEICLIVNLNELEYNLNNTFS